MTREATVFCDLEGVLMPEMWPHLAVAFDIPGLSLTTRQVPDYRALMGMRLDLLRWHGITLADICTAVAGLDPFPGALDLLAELNEVARVVIVSDSFDPMNSRILRRLDIADVLCHRFIVDDLGIISGCDYWNDLAGKHLCMDRYPTRQGALTFAIGDAFNDLTMIRGAVAGALFNPSDETAHAAPDLDVAADYGRIRDLFGKAWQSCAGVA